MTLKHLVTTEERRAKLKQVLQKKGTIKGIEVHNALSGLIANDIQLDNGEEFDFFWESSLTDSASKGHPDIEIVSFDSRLRTVSEILEVTDKPIIVDGDTGGNIHHFEYLVPKLERAGVSAVIIEDKVFPKKNSLEPGTDQTQEDPHKFAKKIAVGKQIQRGDNFMIIARIESLIAGKTVEDALERARIYLEAGADGIMIHSKDKDPSDLIRFSKEYENLCTSLGFRKPLVCVPTTYNSVYDYELRKYGFNIIIYANHMLRASYKAMKDVGESILKHGRALEVEDKIIPVKDLFKIVGFMDIKVKDQLLSDVPQVIIPAAGVNHELSDVLGDLPKPLFKISGKTILEHQIERFNSLGLKDVNVVIGYQKQKFEGFPKVNFISTDDYQDAGVLNSLMSAKEKMADGFVYMMGDIIADERLLKELLGRKEDIVITVDNSYRYHKHQEDKKLDAVITKWGSHPSLRRLRHHDDTVLRIGSGISKDEMTHEHIGLGKFTKKGASELIKLYDELSNSSLGRFHNAENFKKADLMDILQELVNRGVKVSVHETDGGWIELHDKNDLRLADEIMSSF